MWKKIKINKMWLFLISCWALQFARTYTNIFFWKWMWLIFWRGVKTCMGVEKLTIWGGEFRRPKSPNAFVGHLGNAVEVWPCWGKENGFFFFQESVFCEKCFWVGFCSWDCEQTLYYFFSNWHPVKNVGPTGDFQV